MAIKKVWIEEGCIADGICQEICPDVFGEDDEGEAYVIEGADLNANEDCIKEAAEECPAEVIKYEEE
ncbi:MAG: ferredoxin [Bacteroidota bacterium]